MSTTIGAELPAHPFFLATLFVPQSRSLPERPHPIFIAFLRAGQRNVNQARQSVSRGRVVRIVPRE